MRIFNLILIVLLCASCTGNSQEKKKKNDEMNEQLMKMNQARVSGESKRIEAFITSRSYNMQRSGTGLRYEIYRDVTGDTAKAHNLVEVSYKIFLLDGTLCYSSDSLGNAKFKLGEGQQISGMEEGLMMMQKGDKARLVLPAHLAFGLSGDQKKIPPSQPVFIDMELINIKK